MQYCLDLIIIYKIIIQRHVTGHTAIIREQKITTKYILR